MNGNALRRGSAPLLIALLFASGAHAALTDISTVPLETYSAASSTDVKPNVLFVLDDSGSMDWDFMPDWACSSYSTQNSACTSLGQSTSSSAREYFFRNSSYNGVYYNPGIRYKPPIAVDSTGATNTTTFPSQTGAGTTTGADSTTKPNWKYVKDDAYGVQSATRTDMTGNGAPYFFAIVPGEYCATPALRTCATQTAATATYPYPAYIRWCNSSALTTCKAGFDATYSYVRMPSPKMAIFSTAGSKFTKVTAVSVGATNILGGTATCLGTPATWASDIVTRINAAYTTNGGYLAYYDSSNIVYVVMPYPATASAAVTVTTSTSGCSGSGTSFSYTGSGTGLTFTRQGTSAEAAVPGANLLTVITSDRTSYTFPNTNSKAAGRADCASPTSCTYSEEMTNYANWWTYYRTRMQMMKTSASNAFAAVDSAADLAANKSRFRLGYMSINNNTGSDFANLNEFKTTQKYTWYQKLLAASPSSSTPLRTALSDAGRLYAGVLNGTSFNGTTVTDPLQYSCQQNYTILSTDGFWNTGNPYKLNGTTAIGNQDAALARPLYDGGSATVQARTSSLQARTITSQAQTSTSSLQQRTGQLQTRTSSNSGSTWTAWSNAASCTWDGSGSTRAQCQYVWSAFANAASCTVAYSTGTSGTWTGNGTDCQYTAWTSYANTASCTTANQSASPTYTVGTASRCNTVVTNGAWANASSCTTSSTQGCQYTSWSSWSNVSSCTVNPQSVDPNYTVGTAMDCQTLTSGGSSDSLSDVAAYYYGTDLRDPVSANGTGTCTGPVIPPNTVANDLCANNVPSNGRDVATTQHMTTFTVGLGAQGEMVFSPSYWTDTSGDFYDIKVGSTTNTSLGVCSWQVSGVCNWPNPVSNSITTIDDLWHTAINGRGSYFSASDPQSLADGLAATLSTISNIPTPGTAAAAAASNPNISAADNYVFSTSYKSVQWYGELIRQQIDSTGNLTPQQWSALQLLDCATTPWIASTSYAAGNIYNRSGVCYKVNTDYTSSTAFGSTDTTNTTVVTGSPVTRKIYVKNASNLLVDFQWANLSSTQKTYFSAATLAYSAGPPATGLSQFCSTGGTCLSSTARTNETVAAGGAAGEALVNFLRGDRSNEGTFYRTRTHVLGDIVSSEARYVKVPAFKYGDAGYADFKVALASRNSAVYVAANDGMLHAFDAETGQERWSYIPSMVMPNLYVLADKNYSDMHQYFVDATPEVGDICPTAPATACTSTTWKTIIVGGLNRGGKGYYALDITDPTTPLPLWEFTDATSLGWSYGNPVITKLKDGTWVVLFSSGYNNADGIGRLYVVNASTGALIRSISTSTGSATSPSGIAGISGHAVLPTTNNTSLAAYGGDLLGNLWRFDINGDIGAAGYDAQLLATFKDAAGNTQSVENQPSIVTYNGSRIVFVGTGRFLGTTDVADTSSQSFYAVKDNLGSSAYASIRTASTGFVAQTLTSATCPAGSSFCAAGQTVRTGSSNAVDWSSKNGWYLDFITGGERTVSNSSLQLGTLLFTTITPLASTANACGSDSGNAASFVYALDYKDGSPLQAGGAVAGTTIGSGLATAPIYVELTDGSVRAIIRVSDGSGVGTDMGGFKLVLPPIDRPAASAVRRVTWRELSTQ